MEILTLFKKKKIAIDFQEYVSEVKLEEPRGVQNVVKNYDFFWEYWHQQLEHIKSPHWTVQVFDGASVLYLYAKTSLIFLLTSQISIFWYLRQGQVRQQDHEVLLCPIEEGFHCLSWPGSKR